MEFEDDTFDWQPPVALKSQHSVTQSTKSSAFPGLKVDFADDEFEIVLGAPEESKKPQTKSTVGAWADDLDGLADFAGTKNEGWKETPITVLKVVEPVAKPPTVPPPQTVQSSFEAQMLALLQDTNSLDDEEEDSSSQQSDEFEVVSKPAPLKAVDKAVVKDEEKPQSPVAVSTPSFPGPKVEFPAQSEDVEKTTAASTTSSQVGLALREVMFKVAPPSTPALSSSFRRHRFVDKLSKTGSISLPNSGVIGKFAGKFSLPNTPPSELASTLTAPFHLEEIPAPKEKEKPIIPRLDLGVIRPQSTEVKAPVKVEEFQLEIEDEEPQPAKQSKQSQGAAQPVVEKPAETGKKVEQVGKLPVAAGKAGPANPMQMKLHNKLSSASKKPAEADSKPPERQRRPSNEFEEDAMGEAREWQAFSANPELNDDSSDGQEDEFSISAVASIKVKAGADKQYTSVEETKDKKPTLESVLSEKKKEEKKGKKIDLKTRKMIAEAKLQDANPPVESKAPIQAPVPKPVQSLPPKVEEKPIPPLPKTQKPVTDIEFEEPIELMIDDSGIDTSIGFHDIGRIPSPKELTREQVELEDEWSKATAVAVSEMNKPKEELKTALITFGEVWPVFEAMDIRAYREPEEEKKAPAKPSWLRRCFSSMPEELDDTLIDQRRRILSLLKVPFNESPLHLQVLMSVWKLLTATTTDCPRFGHHWDRLGFQGADPATDLRSMGIYGLLQILFLASTLKNDALAILSYSRTSGCNFPFAAVSLNITKMMVETLREGKLNKVNFFYAGVFLYWFQLYQKRELTVADIGFLNKEVTTEAKASPEKMMRVAERAYKSAPPKL